jgi:hypothetical protein
MEHGEDHYELVAWHCEILVMNNLGGLEYNIQKDDNDRV